MIRVQLAKEYRQPDPEGQQTYGKQELLHNGRVAIQRSAAPRWAVGAADSERREWKLVQPINNPPEPASVSA